MSQTDSSLTTLRAEAPAQPAVILEDALSFGRLEHVQGEPQQLSHRAVSRMCDEQRG